MDLHVHPDANRSGSGPGLVGLPEVGALGRVRHLARRIAITDAGSVLASFLLAYGIRFGFHTPSARALIALGLVVPTWLAIFSAYRLYRLYHLAPAEEFRRLIAAVSVGIAVVAAGSFWTKSDFPRIWLGLSWGFSLLLVMMTRGIWHRWLFRKRVSGEMSLRTLVVGDNSEAQRIARTLSSGPYGFTPIGVMTVSSEGSPVGDLPWLGSLDEATGIIAAHGVECVYVASSAVSDDEAKLIANAVRAAGVEFRVSANLYDVLSSRLAIHPLADLLVLSLSPAQLSGIQAALKRLFDLVVAIVLIVLLSPLLILVGLVIATDSRGPVLFRQDRVTKGGRTFQVLKFRTMVRDADKVLREHAIDPTVPFFKLKQDPRLTRTGRWLRRFSLDELPQLVNVIKGDMSLVGPRPLPADQVAANLDLLSARHEVRAGVTGWWQIQGRSNLGAEEAVRMDLFYIENWSLSLDLYILAKTVRVLVNRHGAY